MANLNFINSVDFTTNLTLTPEINFFLSLLCQCLCLISESIAERQRSAELAAQRKQAAAQTIFLWLHRRLLLVRINRWTLQHQQHDVTLARLRYKQDCCRHAAVTQERRHHEEAAKCAAALAQPVRQRARPYRRTS